MRLEIRFRHMDRSEALEALATEKITDAVEGFVHRHDAHVQIWLVSDLNRTNRGTGQFICEIEVRYPKKKDVFIRKSDSDMHVAIQEAADKLKILLDEAGKKERSLRRGDALETSQAEERAQAAGEGHSAKYQWTP